MSCSSTSSSNRSQSMKRTKQQEEDDLPKTVDYNDDPTNTTCNDNNNDDDNNNNNNDDSSIANKKISVQLIKNDTNSTTSIVNTNNNNNNSNNNNNKNNNTDSNTIIYIDGSKGEGGGQMIRNAISYAVILQKELIIINIRSKRSKPGLQAQHVTAIQVARSSSLLSLSDTDTCTLLGNHIGSSQIHYIPAAHKSNERKQSSSSLSSSVNDDGTVEGTTRYIKGDTGTAGSICLILQAAVPCCLLNRTSSMIQLDLKGGTNASMAPQYDYWDHVFWPTIQKHCLTIPPSSSNDSNSYVKAKVLQRGFFPKGGGHVQVLIRPLLSQATGTRSIRMLQPINLTERGNISKIYIRSYHAGNLPRHVAQTMANTAKTYFQSKFISTTTTTISEGTTATSSSLSIQYQLDVVTERNAIGSSFGILIVAQTSTGCLLGGSSLSSVPKYNNKNKNNKKNKMKRAEDVAIDACDELWTTLQVDNCCVDVWLQDQLILFMTLASGQSSIITGSLSLHTQTAISIAQQMTNVKFTITKLDDECATSNTVVVTDESNCSTVVTTNHDTKHATTSHDKKKDISRCSDDTNYNHASVINDDSINRYDDEYGQHGCIPGKHLIQCVGIGWSF